jgi:hypothetical protein
MQIGVAVKLETLDDLFEHFSSPPPSKHIHIVVQVPPICEFFYFAHHLPVNDYTHSFSYQNLDSDELLDKGKQNFRSSESAWCTITN